MVRHRAEWVEILDFQTPDAGNVRLKRTNSGKYSGDGKLFKRGKRSESGAKKSSKTS